MNITTTFQTDLTRRSYPIRLEAVQNDGNTRALQLTLTAAGQPWQIPAGVTAAVAFRKPDGHKGLYDTLPDGKPAVTMEGNTLTAILAPQALTCAGQVAMSVVLTDENLNRLATFPFAVDVAADPSAGAAVSNDYYRYSTMEAVSEALESAQRNAPSIVCDRSGMQITVTDAAARPLENLRIFGRTTQSAVPAPLEHITNPAVTLWGKNLIAPGDAVFRSSQRFNIDVFKENPLWLPQGTYTVSCAEVVHSIYVRQQGVGVIKEVLGTNAATFTLEEPKRLWFDFYNTAGFAAETLHTLQLEAGAQATAYEPYKAAQTITVATPNGLPGIPVTDGGNYTDENGQQWICDELDLARGKYIRRVKQVVLNGSEKWHLSTKESTFVCDDTADALTVDGTNMGTALAMADTYRGASWESCPGYDYAIALAWGNGVAVRNKDCATIDAWKAYLAQHPCAAIYPLKTPVETQLPTQTRVEFAALHTHKPNTTLCAEAPVTLSYVADTKTYIDNRLRSALTGGSL